MRISGFAAFFPEKTRISASNSSASVISGGIGHLFPGFSGKGILSLTAGLQHAAFIGSAGVQCRSGEIGQTRSPQKRVAPQLSGFKPATKAVSIPAPAHYPANRITNVNGKIKEIGFRNWSGEPVITPQLSVKVKDPLLFKPFASNVATAG